MLSDLKLLSTLSTVLFEQQAQQVTLLKPQ
jgi:hypothetical protein